MPTYDPEVAVDELLQRGRLVSVLSRIGKNAISGEIPIAEGRYRQRRERSESNEVIGQRTARRKPWCATFYHLERSYPMKLIGALALAFAVSVASAANPAESGGTSGDSMSGMMGGPAAGMMRDMPMNAPRESLGRERPLLNLALQNRAELGLSAEQEKALRELVDRFGKEAARRSRDIETAEGELAGLLKQEPARSGEIEGKVRAVEKVRADLRLARIRIIAEGRAALTPEQRTKLDQLAARPGHPERGEGTRGAEEMQRFMSSERMPQAMSAMMAMAERMGGGDTMLGMVRMMEMMSMMGGGGMMQNPPRSQQQSEESK